MKICNIDQLRYRLDITYLSYQKLFSQREVEKVYILLTGRRRISIKLSLSVIQINHHHVVDHNHYTSHIFRAG